MLDALNCYPGQKVKQTTDGKLGVIIDDTAVCEELVQVQLEGEPYPVLIWVNDLEERA